MLTDSNFLRYKDWRDYINFNSDIFDPYCITNTFYNSSSKFGG